MRPGAPSKLLEISSLSAIEHIVLHRPKRIQRITAVVSSLRTNPRAQKIHDRAKRAGIPVDISQADRSPDPMRAYLPPFQYADFKDLREEASAQPRALILALDHLQDPQNFGALCRTAEGLGISGIIIPKDRGVVVGQGVYHASVGAVETVPVALVSNLSDALRKLKEDGFWIIGTQLGGDATPPSAVPDFEKAVLVLGAEWEGLSQSVEKACDWRVEIPLPGKVQSLNVSAAGAIMMWELTRRLARK